MIRFSCPSCSKSLKVDVKYAGRRVACPKCGEKLSVPADAPPKPSSDAAKDKAAPEPPKDVDASLRSPSTGKSLPSEEKAEPRRSLDDLFDDEFDDEIEDTPEPPPSAAAPAGPSQSPDGGEPSTLKQTTTPSAPPEDPSGDDATDARGVDTPSDRVDELQDEQAFDEAAPTAAAARVGSREKRRPDFTPGMSLEEHEAWEKYIEDERRAREKPPEDELDMTPMVDVTFLLLIFFMVTVSFQLQKSMRAQAPESEQEAAASAATEDEPEEEPIIIEVTDKNEIFVDGRKIPLPEIGEAISELKAGEPRLELMMEVDRGALHGTVVEVMDAAAKAGVERVKRSSVGG